jgi:hypothetical protein
VTGALFSNHSSIVCSVTKCNFFSEVRHVWRAVKTSCGVFANGATTGTPYAAFGTQIEQINGSSSQTLSTYMVFSDGAECWRHLGPLPVASALMRVCSAGDDTVFLIHAEMLCQTATACAPMTDWVWCSHALGISAASRVFPRESFLVFSEGAERWRRPPFVPASRVALRSATSPRNNGGQKRKSGR